MDAPAGLPAGPLATPALLGADAAVLVMGSMLFAFLRADPARQRACLDHRSQHVVVRTGAPGGERSRGRANVGTIQVQADALAKLGRALLCNAGVGTRGARLRASIARLDASDQRLADAALHVGMCRNHRARMHEASSVGEGCRADNSGDAARFHRCCRPSPENCRDPCCAGSRHMSGMRHTEGRPCWVGTLYLSAQ